MQLDKRKVVKMLSVKFRVVLAADYRLGIHGLSGSENP